MKTFTNRRIGTLTLSLLLALTLLAVDVHACACCADEGMWYRAKVRRGGEEPQMMKEWAQSVTKASLMVGNADLSEFGQISPTASSSVFGVLSKTVSGRRTVVEFTDSVSGAVGGLGLTGSVDGLPIQFMADIRDGREGEGGGVLLYKELIFEGTAKGTGFFAKGIPAGSKFTLVLQGRGNGCHDKSVYRHWTLRMGRLTFYGEMGM